MLRNILNCTVTQRQITKWVDLHFTRPENPIAIKIIKIGVNLNLLTRLSRVRWFRRTHQRGPRVKIAHETNCHIKHFESIFPITFAHSPCKLHCAHWRIMIWEIRPPLVFFITAKSNRKFYSIEHYVSNYSLNFLEWVVIPRNLESKIVEYKCLHHLNALNKRKKI